ncbi:MAG TPA: acyl-CoA dehydrogenase family protein [Leptospiraceae bacterium]|nr:acyl-CoA dehydrogenase family protein [Leptospiraceae bacterium]
MIQNNYFNTNEDLKKQFSDIIDWKEIVDAFENGFADAEEYKKTSNEHLQYAPSNYEDAIEYYRTLLENLGDITGTTVASLAAEMDRIGLKYDSGNVTFPDAMIKAYKAVQETGLQPYGISRRRGGLGIPCTVQALMMELLGRADASLAIALGCANLAETIERFASKEMSDKYVPLMASGELTGAMALTEPNYGSDLPGVQTKAEKGADGIWRLTGTKRFITHACGFAGTPSVILTLARTGSPTSGARGLSFFLVHGKDVHVASIEKKMGLHCSPTCEVVYDNSPGELIGEESQGLVKYAMGMMNTARLSIAAQAMGIGSAAYFEAKKYASERVQFGKTIDKIPAVRKMLDLMERETAAMRCLLIEASRTVDLYLWRLERLEHSGLPDREVRKDEQVRKWEKLANYFTPLSKYYTSEMCNKVAYDAVQIHGGSGYTEDYDVSRIFRDARITNIYEGTTQLQVVASIGGVVAGMAPAGHLRAYLDEEMAKFQPSAELTQIRATLEDAITAYKSISDGDSRDMLSFELVEMSARLIAGMLLERAASRQQGADRADRLRIAKLYNSDSQAICAANTTKIKNAGSLVTA